MKNSNSRLTFRLWLRMSQGLLEGNRMQTEGAGQEAKGDAQQLKGDAKNAVKDG
jgi:hypothetical protein